METIIVMASKKSNIIKMSRGRKNFLAYEAAKEVVNKAKVNTFAEWIEFCHGSGRFESNKKPGNIPANPNLYYGPEGTDEWVDWGTFLGTGNVANNKKRDGFVTYEEAMQFCHEQGIRSIKMWREFAETPLRPIEIPSAPNIVYHDSGWVSWNDFLLPKFLEYNAAKKFIQTLAKDSEITTSQQWRVYAAGGFRPENIPANPERVYKDKGWKNWPDFLGTGRAPRMLTYIEAKKHVSKLRLLTHTDYKKWAKSDDYMSTIPENPEEFYADKGWISWEDFLDASLNKSIVKIDKAKNMAVRIGPKVANQWHQLIKAIHFIESQGSAPSGLRASILTNKLPDNPREYYSQDGWNNWADFLLSDEEFSAYKLYRRKKTLGQNLVEKARVQAIVDTYINDVIGHKTMFKGVLDNLPKDRTSIQSSEKVSQLFNHYGLKSYDDWRALVCSIYISDPNGEKNTLDVFFGGVDLDIEKYYTI